MTKIKLAFQGEKGAYSHIACDEIFKGAEVKNCKTFEEVFQLVFNDVTYKAIIPIENSLAGRVADIHYLLPKFKLQIYAEHYQKVEHCLLCRSEVELKDIKYVRSHAQAIGQCQEIIKKNNFKSIISADTAGSAKDLSESNDYSIAAIASELAAKTYGLKILKKNIEDEAGNITRFLVMGKNISQPRYDKNNKYITTCIFRLKSEASALHKSLGGFATNQINLTKLESFSVKNSFEQVNFYLDFEGHIDQKPVQKSLEELRFHTESLDILGVYEASAFRQK
jgi:prephenate dehydratase